MAAMGWMDKRYNVNDITPQSILKYMKNKYYMLLF